MSPEKPIRPSEQFGRTWGDNTVFGTGEVEVQGRPISILDLIREECWLELTDIFAWSEACPVKDQLMNIRKRSPKELAHRYAQVMFWRGYFMNQMEKAGHPEWVQELMQTRERDINEPAGNYDLEWVPDKHITHIFGPGSPVGYALPRVFLQFIGDDKTQMRQRINDGLMHFDFALNHANDPTELTCIFTSKLSQTDNQSVPYLRHLVGQGKLEEDNCMTDYKRIAYTMQRVTPQLWDAYNALGVKGRLDNRIAEIEL